MRADAARNQRKIFDAAKAAVAQGDTGLTLNALARLAGVGVGTVYGLFPTQRAMLEAVVEDAVIELNRMAAEAEREPNAQHALGRFLDAALATALAQPGLFEVLITVGDERESLREAKIELVQAISRLLARAQPNPLLTGENLLKLLCGLIHAVNEHPAERRAAAADAYLSLLRTGLTTGAPA
ncbi:TetR/AcrR family transcriptional regulator [Actinoalloteichus hymeniacidonis]|uniref:Transcriptional regulator, TetR family n=1 Tax=Actinoalloteichus hymeniacidonis TaxID=340345 RepID=A0AAC9MZJ2_9PSEU|nr:TetR/AcrR family transcriptional regulator [Actinoalloteichus hymeniacidonis]AOS64514.1 transcriptional regulator, TetR family [Actinoalloteichus hymeniacidonis]MBB5907414.1 AcrR family transcriptional regulator [Actinoalloteichus hymeniacidonis]